MFDSLFCLFWVFVKSLLLSFRRVILKSIEKVSDIAALQRIISVWCVIIAFIYHIRNCSFYLFLTFFSSTHVRRGFCCHLSHFNFKRVRVQNSLSWLISRCLSFIWNLFMFLCNILIKCFVDLSFFFTYKFLFLRLLLYSKPSSSKRIAHTCILSNHSK